MKIYVNGHKTDEKMLVLGILFFPKRTFKLEKENQEDLSIQLEKTLFQLPILLMV